MGKGSAFKQHITGTSRFPEGYTPKGEDFWRRGDSNELRGSSGILHAAAAGAAGIAGKGNAKASFTGVNQEEFAKQKREEARRKRADRREERKARREERREERRARREEKQNYYREQRNERRRPEPEMGDVNTTGRQDYYREQSNSVPNTEASKLAQWNAAKARADNTVNTGGTNLRDQSQGIDFRPGSAAPGTINQEPQADNRDFKKLYEELLKKYNLENK